jgi:hypothetical protein
MRAAVEASAVVTTVVGISGAPTADIDLRAAYGLGRRGMVLRSAMMRVYRLSWADQREGK